MRLLRLIQTVILIVVGMLCLSTTARAQNRDTANRAIEAWNETVATIEPEDHKFRELCESLKRNPPGRVLLTPDVRAAQKKRRLQLIAEIIDSHEKRIRELRRLAKAEEESP